MQVASKEKKGGHGKIKSGKKSDEKQPKIDSGRERIKHSSVKHQLTKKTKGRKKGGTPKQKEVCISSTWIHVAHLLRHYGMCVSIP